MTKNIVVLGGSYSGAHAVQQLVKNIPYPEYRIILVEQSSHFVHRFALPRFSVVPDHDHKAFIPYQVMLNPRKAGRTDIPEDEENNFARFIQARGIRR